MALVTVVTPVYATPTNGRTAQLLETIASVQQQTVPYKHILVNDGSTDPALQPLLESVAASDSRMSVIHQQNGGCSAALNAGIAAVDTPAMTVLHSDDLLPPYSLERRLQALTVDAPFVYGDYALFGSTPAFVPPSVGQLSASALERRLRFALQGIPYPSMLWFTHFFRDLVGGYDPELSLGEDRDVAYRSVRGLVATRKKAHFVPHVVALYRLHEHNITHQNLRSGKAILDEHRIAAKHWQGFPAPLVRAYTAARFGFTQTPEPIKRVLRPFRDGFKPRSVLRYDDSWRHALPSPLAQ